MDTRTQNWHRLIITVTPAIMGLGPIIAGVILKNDLSNSLIGGGGIMLLVADIARSSSKAKPSRNTQLPLWQLVTLTVGCFIIGIASILTMFYTVQHSLYLATAAVWVTALAALDGLMRGLFKLPR